MNGPLDAFRSCLPYFEVLADPVRQQLVVELAHEHGSLNVGALTERVSLSRPAVSHHLKVLAQAGMVAVVRKGTENYYYLTLKDLVVRMKTFVQVVEHDCGSRL